MKQVQATIEVGTSRARQLVEIESSQPVSRSSVVFLPAFILLGCAHASPAPLGEEVLDRGGELADIQAERRTVEVTGSTVTVWGLTEVPDGSRMQMALAGVDAITRSELLKAVQVRVA
jgi:hypothetical protein